jgi:pyruvate kinase
MRRTKIVCTLGPAVTTKERIGELIAAGMNVARINCSHGDWPTRRQWIDWIRELSPEVAPVAVLADLQGPKFRLGKIENDVIELFTGQSIAIGPSPSAVLPLSQPEILAVMDPGDRLLLGDGDVELLVTNETGANFQAEVLTGGTVKSRQGITLVGKSFDVPSITDKDRIDLKEALNANVDYIALSYVRCGSDMAALRQEVNKVDPKVKLCAKVETEDALRSIDSIIAEADIIMVARGDMGLQMNIEDVPIAQKTIIGKCNHAGKSVITATQMLESMVHNARPTRAEVTDVANAILDGTDAVMLSGETAMGAYPIESVRYMSRIAQKAESIYDHSACLSHYDRANPQGVQQTEAVAFAVAQMATLTHPKAILTTSTSGQTPRLVSRFRPEAPIWCATWDDKTYRQMAVVWGVESVKVPLLKSADDITESIIGVFLREGRLVKGDRVIITSGVPVGVAGNTNLIMTETVKHDTEVPV